MERVFVRIFVCSEMVYIKYGKAKGKTVQIDKRFLQGGLAPVVRLLQPLKRQ